MNVVLIGDSIRMFYEEKVREKLGSEYQVFSPKENCRFSAYVLNSLRFWLNEFPAPDIIHFNAGLWDTAILYREDGCFTALDEYIANMKKVLRVLKSTGATLIFATITPVSDEKETLSGPIPPAHRNADIVKYNEAMLKLLEGEGVYINDLFTLMYSQKEKYLCEDMIHPNSDGIELLSNAVAEIIKTVPTTANSSDKKIHQINRDEKTIQ